MFGKLFLVFTLVPVAELYVLLQIGERIGGFTTFAMVVLTGVIGAALARAEGLRVLKDWQQSVHEGRVPAAGVVNGALVLLGCALLISPGVITDLFGLLLLVPFTRRVVARAVTGRVKRMIEHGALRYVSGRAQRVDPYGDASGPFTYGRPDVIDVTGEPVEPEQPPTGSLPKSREPS